VRDLITNCLFDLLQLWKQLDDTIMGGQSNSKLDVTADGTAIWTGTLVVVRSCCTCCLTLRPHVRQVYSTAGLTAPSVLQEGGGFCGQRTESRDLDLGSYAGVRLRVRGDGQTYKLNLKTVIGLRASGHVPASCGQHLRRQGWKAAVHSQYCMLWLINAQCPYRLTRRAPQSRPTRHTSTQSPTNGRLCSCRGMSSFP
jgi:Complex I intermediate-associated protein 30 (CIA30)